MNVFFQPLTATARIALLVFAVILLAAPHTKAYSWEVLAGHEEYVYTVAFSSDGRLMATAAGDNTAIVWNVEKRKPTYVLPHEAAVYAAAVSPNGKFVATASGDGCVALWKALDGSKIQQEKLHKDAVYCIAFSPDGKLLASAGGSTDGGDTTCRISRAVDLTLVMDLPGHQRQVYGVAFSPDGQMLATGSSDKTIRIWNLESRNFTVLKGHTSDIYRCDFSPDGKWLASTSQDGSVRVWCLSTGSVSRVLEGSSKTNPFYSVVFSADGGLLAAVNDDCKLRIWRTSNWELVLEQRLSRKALYAIAFSPDQEHVLVAGEDGKIYSSAVREIESSHNR